MLKEKKYWITYWMPGSFTANTSVKDCKELPLIAEVEWPENAYALTLHQREDAIDGEKVYKGESEQIGPMYYHPDSKVTTLEETKAHPHTTKTLISNMECNGWDAVIWTRWGNWPQPFENGRHEIVRAI
jgi:hypothetical protein